LQIECSSIVDYAQKIVDSNKFSDGKYMDLSLYKYTIYQLGMRQFHRKITVFL